MAHWTEFGIRRMQPMSARTRVVDGPPPVHALVDERAALLHAPLSGVTDDGTVRTGLYALRTTGVSTEPITEAAQAFLQALTPDQRDRVCFPVDAEEWRTWINVHMNFFRHGLMLEDLDQPVRDLALGLLGATLSARGYDQARDIMRINGLQAELSGSPDEFGEWPYFVTIFGDPSDGEPWGWQIDGHHLAVNCMVVGDQLVTTPTFMGAEPTRIDEGRLAGTRTFVEEHEGGLTLIRSLDPGQATKAVLRPSILPGDLPRELQHPFDGRMVGGAFRDNAVIPYAGVCATDLSDAQRGLLTGLAANYIGWTTEGHASLRMEEVRSHLDETWFSWMGATGDEGPFYYRVHSPVVLIEFDHHPGVVFDNEEPTMHHVHTLVRTPHGGDYGADLLGQHHDRYDHSHGHHEPRED